MYDDISPQYDTAGKETGALGYRKRLIAELEAIDALDFDPSDYSGADLERRYLQATAGIEESSNIGGSRLEQVVNVSVSEHVGNTEGD